MSQIPRYGQAFLLPNGSIAPVWYDYLRTLDVSSLTAEIERQVQANTEAIKALEKAGFGDYLPASAYVLGTNSVETFGELKDGARVMLRGDVALPDPTTYYGANQDQERGFHPISGAIEAETGELTKAVGEDGVATFGLSDVPDQGGGTLQRLQRDEKGRVSGTSEATTDDLPEGGNLYFTDERAVEAVTGTVPLGDLADVDTEDAEPGEALVFDGGAWVPGSAGTALHYRRDDITAAPGDNEVLLDQEPYESSLDIFVDGLLLPLSAYSLDDKTATLSSLAVGGEVFSIRYWSEEAAGPSSLRGAWTPALLFQNGEQGGCWDFTNPNGLFQDAAGTVPVVAFGDPIGMAADLSGNGNHLLQATVPARPTYTEDGALHDGVDDFLMAANAADWTFLHDGSGGHMAFASSWLNQGGVSFIYTGTQSSGVSSVGLSMGRQNASLSRSRVQVGNGETVNVGAGPTGSLPEAQVFAQSVECTNSRIRAWLNNVQWRDDDLSDFNLSSDTPSSPLRTHIAPGNGSQEMRRMLAINRTLTESERASVNAWLMEGVE